MKEAGHRDPTFGTKSAANFSKQVLFSEGSNSRVEQFRGTEVTGTRTRNLSIAINRFCPEVPAFAKAVEQVGARLFFFS